MAVYTTLTLRELIEETLDMLYRSTERPKTVLLSSGLDEAATVTTLTLSGDDGQSVTTSSVLEFGLERLLVTATDGALNPTFTVIRGYAGTTAAEHAEGAAGTVDAKFARAQVRRTILRCLTGPMTRHVPFHMSDSFFTSDAAGIGQQYIELPENTLSVLGVRYMSPTNGRIVDVPGWRFENDMPTQFVSSGRVLRVPSFIASSDDLIVNYTTSYQFFNDQDDVTSPDPDESDHVQLPIGAEDIPTLYTVAYLSAGRELTRSEVDRTEEWNQDMADKRGVNLQALRAAWQLYYQRIDEVHRIHPMPKNRVYRRWQQPF